MMITNHARQVFATIFFSRAICQCMLCTVRACTYTNKLITANNFLPFTRACSFAYPLEIHERIILDVCRRTLRNTPVIDDRFSSYEQTWLKSATHINSRHQPEGVLPSALGGRSHVCQCSKLVHTGRGQPMRSIRVCPIMYL